MKRMYHANSWYSEDICSEECKSKDFEEPTSSDQLSNAQLLDLPDPKELPSRGAISTTCFDGHNDKFPYGWISIAVGEKYILQICNINAVVYTKEGENTALFPTELIDSSFVSPPHCHYDTISKRFLVYSTRIEGTDSASVSTFTLAVSKTENPSLGYKVFKFKAKGIMELSSGMGSWYNGLYISFIIFLRKPTDPPGPAGYSSKTNRLCVINRESLTTDTAKALYFDHVWTAANWQNEYSYGSVYSPNSRVIRDCNHDRAVFFAFPVKVELKPPDRYSIESDNSLDAFIVKLNWNTMQGASRRLKIFPSNFKYMFSKYAQQKDSTFTFIYGDEQLPGYLAEYTLNCDKGSFWLSADNIYSGKPSCVLWQFEVTSRCISIIQQCSTRYGSDGNEGRMFGRPLVNIFGDVALFYFKSNSNMYLNTMLTYRFKEDEQNLLTQEQAIVESSGPTPKNTRVYLRNCMSVQLDTDGRSFIVCSEYFKQIGWGTKICRIKL